MSKLADLHIHTFYSDSSSSPEEVVDEALAQGLACIAITDHDTIDGVGPTQQCAHGRGLEVIAGIELSSEIQDKDVHILGYFLDCANAVLSERLATYQAARVVRIERMIESLKKSGIDNITLAEVCAQTKSLAVGRLHLASTLVEKGWVSNVREAFNRYIGEDGPAFEKKFLVTPYEAIALIRQAGGVAVLAHPMLTGRDELIPSFVEAGLAGLEVYYPNCGQPLIAYYERLAAKHNLVATGGSDAHGKKKDNTYLGKKKVPYEVVEQLRARCG